MREEIRKIHDQTDCELEMFVHGALCVAYSGQYEGKLLWVHHTHDASLWPSDGVVYPAQVVRAQGEEAAAIINKIYSSPPELARRVKEVLE